MISPRTLRIANQTTISIAIQMICKSAIPISIALKVLPALDYIFTYSGKNAPLISFFFPPLLSASPLSFLSFAPPSY